MSSVNEFLDLFSDVWTSGLFGVNVSEIIIGLIIFLIFYVLRSFFARFIIGRLYKIVKKTKTDIDNVVIEVIEGPLKFLPIVIGFFIATSYIEFNADIIILIEKINRTFITIFIFFSFSKNVERLSKVDNIFLGISKIDNKYILNEKNVNTLVKIYQPDIENNRIISMKFLWLRFGIKLYFDLIRFF